MGEPLAARCRAMIVEIVFCDGAAGYGEMAPFGQLLRPAFAECTGHTGTRASDVSQPATGIDALNRT